MRDIEGNDGNGERRSMDSTTSTGDVDSIRVEEALLAVEVSICVKIEDCKMKTYQ